jgi:hypothetical protein
LQKYNLQQRIMEIVLQSGGFFGPSNGSLKTVQECNISALTIDVPVVYMVREVMVLMQAISLTRNIGRGGP